MCLFDGNGTKENEKESISDHSGFFFSFQSPSLPVSVSLSHTKIVRHPSRVSPKSTKKSSFFSSWLSGHGVRHVSTQLDINPLSSDKERPGSSCERRDK